MPRPLNFLHLTTFYPPYSFGGDAMYLYRLCHALANEGHHVDVIHCVDSYHVLHPGKPPIAFEDHPNVKRHELRSGFGWLSPMLTQQSGQPYLKRATIERVLASRQHDVIHFHNASLLGPGALAIEAPHGRAVKMYTTHEHWLVCPMHVLWKFNSRACEKPECFRCTLQGKRPPQWWRYTGLLEESSRHIDQFVSPSRFTSRMHAERGFAPPVAHLPYFIDAVDQDWSNPAPRPQPGPYFLFVGRLEIIKGLQTVIPLWRDLPYDLLVAGTGAYEAELKQMAAGNPRIKFLGALSQKQLGSLYHHAIACILPSITYETFGMISIEAYARKTPVIVRQLGALPEAVEDSGGGGFIYRTDDELRDAITKLASSPALRNEMGEKGYQAFGRYWCRGAHMRFYFDFLESCAQRKFGSSLA